MSDVLNCPPPRLSPARIAEALAAWGVTPTQLRPLPSERDFNVMVNDSLVLKVSNPAERRAVVDLETEALAHASSCAPHLPLPQTLATTHPKTTQPKTTQPKTTQPKTTQPKTTQPTVDGEFVVTVRDDANRACLARIISVLPGEHLEGQPISPSLAHDIGQSCAELGRALQGFFHPAANRAIDWDVRRAGELLAEVDPEALGLDPSQHAALISRARAAAAATRALPSAILHADLTLTNILAERGEVSGLIDLGDLHHTAFVCDLAVTLTSVLRNTAPQQLADTWELAAAVLTGYQRSRLLSPEEVAVLGDLVLARLGISLAISAKRRDLADVDLTYIGQYDTASRRLLTELMVLSAEELQARLATIAGTRRARPTSAEKTTSDQDLQPDNLLHRRHQVMGGQLSPLFYQQPLTIVRGSGPWLYDQTGRRYLDAYNNVPVVGHAHPAVVRAVSTQLATLNTHSRYLHPHIVELSERLIATMPPGLDTCLFTTSGTEANELAWRLATAYTGGNGAIVAEHAYHGSSKWFADLSSNEWPSGYQPERVATFSAPRPETGLGNADAVRHLARAAETLSASPAMVIADLGFTSEGILDAPDEFVAGLVTGAHNQGAVFVADEVQAGFGRIGPPLWRFAAHQVVPDIVTLGKPMGNGYPIGAVITRREIADSLAREYEYFSTFAATPAAAVAALTVLDVLQAGGLLNQVVATGEYLRKRLGEVADADSGLGRVRGSGLIAGIDVCGQDGQPDRARGRAFVERLKNRGVLVGITGPHGNVLKIRPPLIWGIEQVDLLADAFAAD